ncbi:acyl-CoA dehydrogenase family protein [Hydrogenophaga sp. 5NK40-0174]|uniref:acyl-CoA dehydrogenase family protein n=1 Tax=Hydrogenophaga sp. 5NK40-0174 TaxID=3127649 RepID=UPI00310B60B3
MDFDFSEDQEQLRDAVRKWVEKGYGFERRRSIVAAGGFDRDAYGELAELGLAGLYIPEDDGGMGMSPIDGMVVMEELGRGLVLEPVDQALIAGAVIAGYGNADVKGEWLPKLGGGEALIVLAEVERSNRYRLDNCKTAASESGGAWTLSGGKSIVPVADQADAFIVPAMGPKGLALFLVDAKAKGVSTTGYLTQEGGRAGELSLDKAAATLLTEDGLTALEHAVDVGVACQCAEAVGIMDMTMDATAEYLNTRKQFRVPLSSFQALRHRMADMKMQLELARSMSYYAALKLNAPAEERRQAIARAKVQLGQSMRYVGQQAIQLHGGIGVTDEYIVSHYFKSLTQIELTYGDTLHHLKEVSERMGDSAGVFA